MRKKRIMMACAIGALLILIGSGAARCAMQQPEEAAEVTAAQEEAPAGIESYYGSAWIADDGLKTLSISDGVMIERAGDSVSVTYFDVVSEQADDEGISVDVAITRTAEGAPVQGVLRIDEGVDEVSATCDAFQLSESYMLEPLSESELSLAAHSEELNEYLGVGDERIAETISAWAQARSPYATTAFWDGEVYVDCNAGTVMTSFFLDDGAATLVQVQYDPETDELVAL